MKIAKVQEMVFINKSNKWYLHVVSIMQDDGSTGDPQLKSDHQMKNASLTNKSSSLPSG
jgi:hypothetical protein